MDLQMPVLDGLEATRRLRTRGFHGPVLALTASAGPETEAECRAAGMNGCLAKPLQLERLREVLEHTLEARAA
jgi:two-component system capsular synthesis sensor histidine kinase RcsC